MGVQESQHQGRNTPVNANAGSQCMPHNHFPGVFSHTVDIRDSRRAASQLGQLNLQKLMEVSASSRLNGAAPKCREETAWSLNLVAAGVDDPLLRVNRPVSRSQQGRTASHLELSGDRRATFEAEVIARSSGSKNISQTLRTRRAADPSIAPRPWSSTPRSNSLQQADKQRNTQSQPAQLSAYNNDISLLSRPAAFLQGSQPMQPSTAAALLEQHRRRLSSLFPAVRSESNSSRTSCAIQAGLETAVKCESAQRTVQSASDCRYDAVPNKYHAQPMQAVPLSLCAQDMSQGQSAVRQPASEQECNSIADCSAVLQSADAINLCPPMQQDSPDLEYELNGSLQSEASTNSSCFTDTSDAVHPAQIGCFLPSLGAVEADFDDGLSVTTNQAMTDASSSIGVAELMGSLGSPKGKAVPLLTDALMGTAPTVAFVGVRLGSAPDPSLTPLR